MLPTLSELLEYHHEKVINSYARAHQIDTNKASALFTDMLLYLWLSKKHSVEYAKNPKPELQFQFVMHEEMREIDNIWHNFILYTQDYTDFCIRYFGGYMHHLPDISETFIQTNAEFSRDLEKYLSYVYDNLGDEIVCRWFEPHIASLSHLHV